MPRESQRGNPQFYITKEGAEVAKFIISELKEVLLDQRNRNTLLDAMAEKVSPKSVFQDGSTGFLLGVTLGSTAQIIATGALRSSIAVNDSIYSRALFPAGAAVFGAAYAIISSCTKHNCTRKDNTRILTNLAGIENTNRPLSNKTHLLPADESIGEEEIIQKLTRKDIQDLYAIGILITQLKEAAKANNGILEIRYRSAIDTTIKALSVTGLVILGSIFENSFAGSAADGIGYAVTASTVAASILGREISASKTSDAEEAQVAANILASKLTDKYVTNDSTRQGAIKLSDQVKLPSLRERVTNRVSGALGSVTNLFSREEKKWNKHQDSRSVGIPLIPMTTVPTHMTTSGDADTSSSGLGDFYSNVQELRNRFVPSSPTAIKNSETPNSSSTPKGASRLQTRSQAGGRGASSSIDIESF